MEKRRVVVTGMGAVTPIGIGIDNFWKSVKDQKTGFAPITHFDTTDYKVKLAAEVKDFDAKAYVDAKEARRMELLASMPWQQRKKQSRIPKSRWSRKTHTV